MCFCFLKPMERKMEVMAKEKGRSNVDSLVWKIVVDVKQKQLLIFSMVRNDGNGEKCSLFEKVCSQHQSAFDVK